MAISRKVREQMKNSSWIRKMFEEGIELRGIHGPENVFDLSLGNPLLEPPAEFKAEITRLVQEDTPNSHRYMPNAGFPEVRASVAEVLAEESGTPFTAAEILMTVGAAGAINTILRSILDKDDEVVLIAPFFAEYVFYVEHQTGVSKIASCDENWLPDIDSLEATIGPRTRAVIINSPNNPTGVIYPESSIAAISAAIQRAEEKYGTEIYLISDEPYRKLIYTDAPYPFIFDHHPRSMVATSHSKDLGLAGERIGYIAVNPSDPGKTDLLDALNFSLRTLGFVNAPALMQRVVAGIQRATVDIDIYRKKRDLLYGALTKIGYDCIEPDGAFYVFPKTPIPDDTQFVAELQKELVLVVPGVGFGTPGFFRASYCVQDWVIEGAITGFEKAFAQANS
ncbi:pyridoxal phosphate-dependent aminotransferase [Candidatus Lucifugimonas marina]|uniref:Pyridoxal phosphate-dependent aminotransferase n=1 Tax=Candidatus Lucifugimonas marina TaxID=3038979 RepID=A0AAJ6CUH0_9CHLR|nr:pyridoxal phosphate-dependent aminotransferase [SAR202 cluster bacterium JH702]MDG0868631.1 pyridoxal phosphate-dependent aminotransferase [SAR202 cluster bacterium JH639]WFG35264.1 pyridoxal phosphate-dependent aminotransferase [SAR202 cluster bacterium JH545]WFG39214.1 pyridoxal phosphate-dependent aminotransferase [SAR202 cluster bacterium JH1073]